MVESLQAQVKKLLSNPQAVRELKTNDGKKLGDALELEAKKFIKILQEEIDEVYSKSEGWYKRSYNLQNAIEKNVSLDLQTNTIIIDFKDDKAWHESAITKFGNSSYSMKAYVPQAVRQGYEVFNSGHFIEGVDFLQNAIDRFNEVKKDWVSVKIEDTIKDNWWK